MKKNKTILHLLLLVVLSFIVSCSSTPLKKKKGSNELAKSYAKLGNYDRVYIANEAPLIAKMIEIVQPELDENERIKIANDIHHAIKKYPVEPQIVISLIDTESNFQYDKISSTGDLSLAQVNVDVWNKEFKRLKLPLIDKEKLVHVDQSYAMEVMAQILSILKKRHSKTDRRWYARYHSNTNKYKINYLKQIEVRMKLLSKAQVHNLNSVASIEASK